MINEVRLLVSFGICLGAVFAIRKASGASYASIVMFICMAAISLFGSKLIEVFGFTTNVGNVAFATVVFCQAVNFETRGNDYAVREMNIVALALATLFLLVQNISSMHTVPATAAFAASVDIIAGGMSNSFPASLTAFYVSQFFFLSLYSRLQKQPLLIRYGAATIVAQIVDSLVFFSALFALTGFALTAEILLTGLTVKLISGAMFIPALVYIVRGKNSVNCRELS